MCVCVCRDNRTCGSREVDGSESYLRSSGRVMAPLVIRLLHLHVCSEQRAKRLMCAECTCISV